jgi:hypothetical protein
MADELVATGAVADEILDLDDAGGVADAADAGDVAVADEADAAEQEFDDNGDPVEKPAAAAEEFTVDGRTIPANVRELFKNPLGGKDAKAAWMERGEFRKTFPEGPRQAVEQAALLAEIGGKAGVDGLKGEIAEYKELDGLFLAGDRRAVDKLAELAPDGFSKLAPEVMAKWFQTDPDACNRTLCGIIAGTFRDGQFESQLERAALYLDVGKTAEAVAVLQGLQKWSRGFDTVAKAPVKVKEPAANAQADKRTQDLDAREAKLFFDDVNGKIYATRLELVNKELATYGPKGKDGKLAAIEPAKREIFDAAIEREAGKRIGGDKAFNDELRRLEGKKDAAGIQKLTRAKMAEVMPDVVKVVSRLVLGSPVTKARVAGKADATVAAGPTLVNKGWVTVAEPPADTQIDRNKTTFEMIFEGKYILKDGRRQVMAG